MHFVRTCPSCNQKLRFPIDKGKIRVTCRCGYSFIADPDDPALYKQGYFDLSTQPGKTSRLLPRLRAALASVRLRDLGPRAINTTLGIFYKLQNFRLLPAREQRRILFVVALAILAIIAIVLLIRFLGAPSPAATPPGGVVI